ncbi:MAG TPA: hypothetical protein VEY07_04515, partial [Thermoplasmata archaeon]|nr:hypothetical protein [Thermoplasmata archaeon]
MPAVRTAPKLDQFALHRTEYSATPAPRFVRLPRAKYLSIEGAGRPGSPGFQERLQALYSVAFTLKFQQKAKGRDFRMLMLEGLYDLNPAATSGSSSTPISWTLLLRMPGFVRASDVARAVRQLREKGKPALVSEVRLSRLEEGRSVQLMHVGPYSAEDQSIMALQEFARSNHVEVLGRHH